MLTESRRLVIMALFLLAPLVPVFAQGTVSADSSDGSAPASDAGTEPAAEAATSTAVTTPTTAEPAPSASEPVQIQLATVTVDMVVPADPSNSMDFLWITVLVVVAVTLGAFGFIFARNNAQKSESDESCDDLKSLLEQKKRELEEMVKDWPKEKLQEMAFEKVATSAMREAKEAYDKLKEAIELLEKRYDLCVLSLPSKGNGDIEVRKSPIEGKGIFALRDFKKGERVVEWGERKKLSPEELAGMTEDEKRRYVSHKDGKHLLSGEPMRYVNHSCEPNTNPKDNGDVALRDIRAGEEITSDYRDFGSEGISCNCGSKHCRSGL